MSVIEITKDNFEEEVLKSDKPVLLDFWAIWCGPCNMLSPVVDEIAEEHPEIKVGKVNTDMQMGLAQQFNVTAIPMLAVMKGGKCAAQSVGVISKGQIEVMLTK